MRLNSLHMTNFRQHADTRLAFDTGLTGIIGPNGSGKTTILEAIAWALYGQPAARGSRDTIRFVRAAARSPVRVELDFELAGHRYRVERGLTNAAVYLDGATAPIANTITGVGELLQRRLGMSRSEFFNTYFTGQKELNVMAAMGPTERAQFLSRVLGYEKLRTAQTMARDRRRILVAETNGLRQAMPDPDAVHRALAAAAARVEAAAARVVHADARRVESEAALAAVTPRWHEAQQARERAQQVLGALRVAESEQNGLSRERERVDRELAALEGARAERERLAGELEPLAALTTELDRLQGLAREEGRRQVLADGLRVVGDDLARLRERRTRIESAPALEQTVGAELTARRTALEELQKDIDARRTAWARDRQEAETKHDALVAQMREFADQHARLKEAGRMGICPTCGQTLGGNFRAVMDDLAGKAQDLKVDAGYYEDRLRQLAVAPAELRELDEQRRRVSQEVATLERKFAKCQAAVQEIAQVDKELTDKAQRAAVLERDLGAIPPGYDAARHAAVRAETARLAPVAERATRLGAQLEREPLLREELARVARGAAAAAERVAELQARTGELAFAEPEFVAIRSEYERAAAAARAAEVDAARAHGEAAAAAEEREAAEAAERELRRTQEKLAGLNRDRRLHEELDRAYSELRTDLNFALRPELSELASAFLTELTDARYAELELDDQYNIIVLEDGIPKPVISGGEEDLANLVLRLAISQMIAERAGQAFSLLVLDEVFGSLDESRRLNVVDLLRRLQDRFEQVILITHIESVREGLDHVVTVRYDEERGASVAEYARGGPAGESPPPVLPLSGEEYDDLRVAG